MLNQLIAEANNPQCDVFWSGDLVRANVLKQKGISECYLSPAAAAIPPIFIDKDTPSAFLQLALMVRNYFGL